MTGTEITHVHPSSIASKVNIQQGDILISINGKRVRDAIDYRFYCSDEILKLKILKSSGEMHEIRIEKNLDEDIGIELKPFNIKLCRNKCIFCFVSQLPYGMRKNLYIKDEDYRLSFLHGNYITLTNLSDSDKKRIVEQRLSPLYISVHSTDLEIRRFMLGNRKIYSIIKEIRYFSSNKIKMHCQIVVCPGINDENVLIKTVEDLAKFYPYVSSIAVVPLGLTKYRRSDVLRALTDAEARKIIGLLQHFRKRYKRKYGDNIVYPSDELYIKAGIEFPPLKEYGELPQLQNGVGMGQLFQSEMRTALLNFPKRYSKRKEYVTFTGIAFTPYLTRAINRLREQYGIKIKLFTIKNNFFGDTVTVTGLITGSDLLMALKDTPLGDVLLVPSVTLKDDTDIFLDDITLSDLEKELGIEVKKINADARGLINAVTGRT
ncbi:MAG: DUF512 domain-containing protein [Nitrospirota bacterium]